MCHPEGSYVTRGISGRGTIRRPEIPLSLSLLGMTVYSFWTDGEMKTFQSAEPAAEPRGSRAVRDLRNPRASAGYIPVTGPPAA